MCATPKSLAGTKLTVIHLDQYPWQPDWVEAEKPDFLSDVSSLTEAEKRVMDGDYKGSFPVHFCRADIVFFRDMNRWQYPWHVFHRIRKSYDQDDLVTLT